MDTPNPHVLIFPFPLQGHVNSMLKLANLLCHANIHITFLLTHNIHARLLRNTNIQSDFSKFPGFRLKTLPEEIYEGPIITEEQFCKFYDSLVLYAKPFLKGLITGAIDCASDSIGSDLICNETFDRRFFAPIKNMIADGMLNVAFDVGEEVGVPVFCFRTVSTSAFWAYFCIPQLIEAGDLPFKGDNMDTPIQNVIGMEQILRRRDLPSFVHVYDLKRLDFKKLNEVTQQTPRAHGLILNTFDDLDASILTQVRKPCPNVYTIGPVHALLKKSEATNSSTSFWKEDRSCIEWLDQQPSRSVLYVSFGSITTLTCAQLLEFWYGLVNSGSRFLWVIRPDSITGENKPPEAMVEATKARGYMVEWAPQEEVLGHLAVGGFLTHSGWNSTLESIVEGIPMICWPFFADQLINSRFVEKVWKFGLDMKGTCDRIVIEKVVKDLMKDKGNEFKERMGEMSKLAKKAVNEGGSSFCNMGRLVNDIRSMSSKY